MANLQTIYMICNRKVLNPFPNKALCLLVCSKSLLKTLLGKEKLLTTGNLSFSQIVFHPSGEFSAIFIILKLLSANSFHLEESKIILPRKGLTSYMYIFNPFPNKPWFSRVCSVSLLNCGKRRNCL